MRMNKEDGKKLMAGMGAMRDLEAELEAIDYKNDPEALEKQGEIMDLMMTFSMGMAPLRKKLATGNSGNEAKSAPEKSPEDKSSKGDADNNDATQTGENS